jgi:RimJ/RimL family protein N-acetyltransferase
MNIETKRLTLRAVEPRDARFLADLTNDPDVRGVLGAYDLVFPMSVEMEERWIESVSKTEDVHMIAVLKSDSSSLGIVSIKDINKRNGSAHISIILQKKSWDKGYGTEAVTGVLYFLFERRNLHRVWLRVADYNDRAIKCYKKCGFKIEGTLREDHYAGNAWRSSYMMSIVDHEFRRRRP